MPNKIVNIASLERFYENIKTYISGLLTTKQDKLISGTNIKTVNGESLIGSGNIISGVKPLITTTDITIELLPNIYYRKTNQSSSLTITLANEENSTILNEYLIEFTTAATGTTVSLPSSIK